MKMKTIGLWTFFAGMVLALINVFFNLGAWVTQALILLGIAAGAFHFYRQDLLTLGITYLALGAAASSLEALAFIGPTTTKLVTAWVSYLGPVVVTAFMLWGGAYLITGKRK